VSQLELLKHVVHQLEAAGIEYMISGSVASSLQGEPRASHDIDIVVAGGPVGRRARGD
jgi:predicted nucleotidyltransferase